MFPKVVLLFIAVPSLLMCFTKNPADEKTPADPAVRLARRKAFTKMSIMAAGYLVYLLLIPVVGFFSASLAAMVGFFLYLGIKNLQILILVPCAILGSIYLFIERFLSFNLPSGVFL